MDARETLSDVRVLCFDVFGTVVDWRTGIEQALQRWVKNALDKPSESLSQAVRNRATSLGPSDWSKFASEWRLLYYKFTREIALDESIPYKTIDEHFPETLRHLIVQWGLEGLWQEHEIRGIAKAWHELPSWPDAPEGIRNLNKKYQTATLANGNTELQQDLAEFADLQWTHCVGANEFTSYKPNPKVYLGVAKRVGQPPENCALVAAHLGDLEAAHKYGFKTIYVERPGEEEWDESKIQEAKKAGWVDAWVSVEDRGFLTVARKMGID